MKECENMTEKYWLKPEEDFSRIGLVIAVERSLAGVSSRAVSEGLCNETSLRRLEQGQIGCEKVLADAFLERIGVSSSHMLFYLSLPEEEYLQTRENWIQVVQMGNWEKAEEYQNSYQEQTKKYHDLHRQFSMLLTTTGEWERYHKEKDEKDGEERENPLRSVWLNTLEEAWEITRKGYRLLEDQEERLPKQMTFHEVFIKSLYLRILEEESPDAVVLRGYLQVLRYLEKQKDARSWLLLYPQIVVQALSVCRKNPSIEAAQKAEVKEFLEKCLEFLKKEGGIYQLPELLLEAETNLEKLSDDIRWLYQEWEEPYPNWSSFLFLNVEEVYCSYAIISGRRKGFGIEQEDLSDDVCSEKEIERIEKRQVNPQKATFQRLATKLRFPSGNGTLVNQVGDPALCHAMWEISAQTKFGNYEGIKDNLKLLAEKKERSIYAKQNLIFLEQTTLYVFNKITPKQHQERLWEALHMTIPNKKPEELKEWAFTRQEGMILNVLAHSYDKLGEQEEGIAWLELLREYYEHQPFVIEHYIDNYELLLLNLGNMYGNIDEYEKAMEAEKIAIRLALRSGRGDKLRLILYDYGWNMEHLWGMNGYTKEKSRPYFEAALEIAKFYGIQRNIDKIKSHLAETY